MPDMNELMTFLSSHWGIVTGVVLIFALIWWMNRKRDALLGYREIGPAEAVAMINREGAIPVDTREPSQFIAGHIKDARNHPVNRMIEAEEALMDVRTEPLIIYCERGIESARAASYLSKQGFSRVCKLRGGLTAWQSAKLPISHLSID